METTTGNEQRAEIVAIGVRKRGAVKRTRNEKQLRNIRKNVNFSSKYILLSSFFSYCFSEMTASFSSEGKVMVD